MHGVRVLVGIGWTILRRAGVWVVPTVWVLCNISMFVAVLPVHRYVVHLAWWHHATGVPS